MIVAVYEEKERAEYAVLALAKEGVRAAVQRRSLGSVVDYGIAIGERDLEEAVASLQRFDGEWETRDADAREPIGEVTRDYVDNVPVVTEEARDTESGTPTETDSERKRRALALGAEVVGFALAGPPSMRVHRLALIVCGALVYALIRLIEAVSNPDPPPDTPFALAIGGVAVLGFLLVVVLPRLKNWRFSSDLRVELDFEQIRSAVEKFATENGYHHPVWPADKRRHRGRFIGVLDPRSDADVTAVKVRITDSGADRVMRIYAWQADDSDTHANALRNYIETANQPPKRRGRGQRRAPK